MGFKEEDAVKTIGDLLNYNDMSKIRDILNGINPNIFSNSDVKSKFKEVLVNMYNAEDLGYLKELLNDFLRTYNQYKGVFHFGFCSEEFRNKFKRSDFNNPFELNRFREIIARIIEHGKNYPKETLGEFFISPRGREKHRIAWFVKEDMVYFCEPFHHDKEYDKFCNEASKRKILKGNYHNWNYVEEFMPLNLKAA